MKGKQFLQKLCYRSGSYLKHNSSTILTVIGAAGVIATTVAAVRATPKALKVLEEAKEEKGEELTKVEVVVNAGPAYIPAFVIGTSTIACIFGANVLNKRQQAAIVSAYALVDRTYKDYRNKVKELLGEETDNQIRDAIMQDKLDCDENKAGYAPGCIELDVNSGENVLFYEEHLGKYFEASIERVKNAEYHLNRNFALRGFASLNEFYGFLGLEEETEYGDDFGWDTTRLIEEYESPWIDFNHRLTSVTQDGLECYYIEFVIPPKIEKDW